ncbi:MAG: caspase family protein [Bacteroidales bacterium]|nr:caspase family protein [Bacteroidales bacterium]
MQRILPRLILSGLLVIITHSALCQADAPVETVLQKGHSRYVTCLDISPDGRYLVTGSFDNTLILWNEKSGKEIRTFSEHTGLIISVRFSPDGKKILSASADHRALVYDIATGAVLAEIDYGEERLMAACFSPDGSKVLTMNDRTETKVWHASTGKLIRVLKKSFEASVDPSWFTPDGEWVMSWVSPQESQLVNLSDTSLTRNFACEKALSYAISPDNKYLAVSTSMKYAKLFDLATGKELHHLDPDEEQTCNGCKTLLAFSHNSKYLLTVSKYSGIVLWNVRLGTPLVSIEFDESWTDMLEFSPDDTYFQVRVDDESRIWNSKTGKEVLKLSFDGQECDPVFSPDGASLFTTGPDRTAVQWNIATGKKARIYKGYLNRADDDGMKFDEGNWYHSHIIRYLSLKSEISLTPDGKYLVKGKIDSTAILLNLETGKVERRFDGHSGAVICSDISPDGKWLVTGSGDRRVKLWNLETGELIHTFIGHVELVFDVRFSADAKYLATASWDGTACLWDVESRELLRRTDFKNESPYTVGFTPNDLYLVTADLGKKLRFWELDAGEEFRRLIGHTDVVADICFTPDGKSLVTASLDGMVKIWDLLSGMLLMKYSGHRSGVYAVAANPSGFIASGSNDRSIHIWDSRSGKLLHRLTGHSGAVTSISFSGVGRNMVSCSIDGEIKVWDLKTFLELYTYIQIDRDNWLAKTPQGYFDGSAEALKQINYVSGLEAIPVGSLFEKYYTPNLIDRIRSGEIFSGSSSDFGELIDKVPVVEMNILPNSSVSDIAQLDSVEWFRDNISLSVTVTDQGGGIDELRLYNNGKLIRQLKYEGAGHRAGKQQEEVVEVPVFSGRNEITAIALDKDRTESEPVSVQVFYDGVVSDINLYILAVGINQYQNPAYTLNYAVDDARSYTRTIRKGATGIFNNINEYFIKDTEATKEKITEIFTEIAAIAGPEDVFVFYFAGHGAVSMGNSAESGDFYIIPFDVTNLYGNEEQLKLKAISADEILEMSRRIKAAKQMFVLDACQSGGALMAFNSRGANREKAVAQLARSTGTFFLLASGAIQYSSEVRELGHGIFTFAILEALEGKADGGLKDEKITVNELKSYVEERVPEITRKYMLTPQYPTGYGYGQDFPIVMVR